MAAYPFNYAVMELLCQELQERLVNFQVIDCLPNKQGRFFFILRKKQHQEALFFCFIPPLIRFHLVHLSPVPLTHSSHPLLSFLKGAFLKKISLLQQDRILQLTFQTFQGERLFIAEFFSKHPNYYLTQSDGKILYALYSLQRSHYQLPSSSSWLPKRVIHWTSHQEVEKIYTELEKQHKFRQEKQTLRTQLAKYAKKLQRKEQELLENLKHCTQWLTIQHEGELIKFHFASIKKGMTSLIVQDWENDQSYHLKLDPFKTIQEEMAHRFRRAKKLQAGIIPLTQYLERTQTELRQTEKQQKQLELIESREELSSFHTTLSKLISKQQQQTKSPSLLAAPIYREYLSAQGLKIWVGKNAKNNDRLTFQLANGRDWWLHAQGYSGSHVIIRLGKEKNPDPETLKDAMQLALYYSKARPQGEGEVCFTQRKFVSRLGTRKAGLVQISKHQKAWIRFDPERYRALETRMKAKTA